MLGPPGRDRRVGNQERQVGQLSPAMIGPPLRREAKQNFDDAAEPDIDNGCYLLARRRRKHDLGQYREWHGQDRAVGLELGAVVTTRGNPPACLVNRRYGSAEMEGSAVPAAFG